ncbi:glycoside hydrolase family 88 protein [Hesseltinella vesiculosa]|uniref:Glycoside hydrolase family 88 protein n=1 Tax=Hesseltinella vesiculosa TaxID=101127 RepID=A0A1X2G7A5_9FUNG|nr:glycoside hydrolase family 88 protein [Hesseltinella vesiculosa]
MDDATLKSYGGDREVFNAVLSTSAIDKVLRVARREPPAPGTFPHCTNQGASEYIYEPSKWWTSGFFPGSLWAICERASKHPMDGYNLDEVVKLARKWSGRIEQEQYNTETHDIGFMIMPSFQRDLEVTGAKSCESVIVNAAESLLTRWNEHVGCIRSWNRTQTHLYCFDCKDTDFLVIIDNMMNLDLLYSASLITGDSKFANVATRHTETTLKHHFRKDSSTYHLIVYNPVTATPKIGLTHQGYENKSTWSRGQAWALYGLATVYKYTNDQKFLEAAMRAADYFMSRVDDGVVYWDFDAPRPCFWDVSAAMIACSGMLLIDQLHGSYTYLPHVTAILRATINGALTGNDGCTILDNSTVNNHEHAMKRITNTGLVYADYYFLEVGNRLLDMGLA